MTVAEKRARRERKKKYKAIFVNGRQKRVPREPTIDGLPMDEFVSQNADPIWLHQNGMWEYLHAMHDEQLSGPTVIAYTPASSQCAESAAAIGKLGMQKVQ
jgi:hypothetical protein